MLNLSLDKIDAVLTNIQYQPFILPTLLKIQPYSQEEKEKLYQIVCKIDQIPNLSQRLAPFKDSLIRYNCFIFINKYLILIFA